MGAVRPSKMPSGKRKARRDDTDFTEYAKGGKVGSNRKTKDGKTPAELAQYRSK
jgi:hypothetical protein